MQPSPTPTAVPISPVDARLDQFSPETCEVVDNLIATLALQANWLVRKKAILDVLLTFDTATSEALASGRVAGLEVPPESEDPRTRAAVVALISKRTVAFFAAAILARLAEPMLTGPEQASFYLLSSVPAHQAAAKAWIGLAPHHQKAFRKVLARDRRLATLLERVAMARDLAQRIEAARRHAVRSGRGPAADGMDAGSGQEAADKGGAGFAGSGDTGSSDTGSGDTGAGVV